MRPSVRPSGALSTSGPAASKEIIHVSDRGGPEEPQSLAGRHSGRATGGRRRNLLRLRRPQSLGCGWTGREPTANSSPRREPRQRGVGQRQPDFPNEGGPDIRLARAVSAKAFSTTSPPAEDRKPRRGASLEHRRWLRVRTASLPRAHYLAGARAPDKCLKEVLGISSTGYLHSSPRQVVQ